MAGNKEKNTFQNTVVESNQGASLQYNESDRIKMYNTALQEKRFLTGKVYKDTNDLKADWTHFEFMLAAHKGIRESFSINHLVGLKTFWSFLWEYLEPVLHKYKVLSESYVNMINDTEDMLSNHANLRIKCDFFEEYVAKEMNNVNRCAYRHWYKKKKDELDVKLKRIVEDEKFRKEEEDRMKAKGARNVPV